MFIDIHTHHKPTEGQNELSVYNLNVPEHLCRCGLELQNTFYSLGIHPWKIYAELLSENLRFIEENSFFDNVKAIGECGLDKLSETPWDLQERAFLAQIMISEKVKKPLIIHCVKAFEELIALRKEIEPKQTWIIHAFRGKPQQMEQLIKHGFYLSFGLHFNEETIQQTPLDKIFLETDDAQISIKEVYEKITQTLKIDEAVLIQQIKSNYSLIFK